MHVEANDNLHKLFIHTKFKLNESPILTVSKTNGMHFAIVSFQVYITIGYRLSTGNDFFYSNEIKYKIKKKLALKLTLNIIAS